MRSSPKTLRAEQKEATRECILDAAIQMLEAHGFAGLRVAAVAEAAGVSPGGYLHHFPSKDSLVAAVFDKLSGSVLARVMAECAAIDGHDDPLYRMAYCAERFYSAPEFLVLLDISLSVRRHTLLNDQVIEKLISNRADTERFWVSMLTAEGIAPAQAIVAVRALWALARGLAISNAGDQAKPANQATIQFIVEAIRQTLTQTASDEASRSSPRTPTRLSR